MIRQIKVIFLAHFNLCLHLSPPVGNGDSGKWNPWFEGETSARGWRARIWRGSERDQRLRTGEIDDREEILMSKMCLCEQKSHRLLFVKADLCFCWQGVRLGVRPDAPPLPRPTRTVKVESGCNVGNPCVSSPCPAHSRCSDQWERHTCICEPGKVQLSLIHSL